MTSLCEVKDTYNRMSRIDLVEQCTTLDFIMNFYKEKYEILEQRMNNMRDYRYSIGYQSWINEKASETLRKIEAKHPSFWTVFKPGGITTKMHKSYEEAEKEAKRLAERQPGDHFFVMEVKSRHEAVPVPQYKHVDEYYG